MVRVIIGWRETEDAGGRRGLGLAKGAEERGVSVAGADGDGADETGENGGLPMKETKSGLAGAKGGPEEAEASSLEGRANEGGSANGEASEAEREPNKVDKVLSCSMGRAG